MVNNFLKDIVIALPGGGVRRGEKTPKDLGGVGAGGLTTSPHPISPNKPGKDVGRLKKVLGGEKKKKGVSVSGGGWGG